MTPEERAPAGNRRSDDYQGQEVHGRLAPATDLVGEIQAIAAAGRRVVARGDLTHREKLLTILALAERARKCEWRFAAQSALSAAVSPFLASHSASSGAEQTGPDPVEHRLVGLRRRGFAQCPECLRPILPDHIERQRILRWAAIDEAREREARRAS